MQRWHGEYVRGAFILGLNDSQARNEAERFIIFNTENPALSKPNHQAAYKRLRRDLADSMRIDNGYDRLQMSFILNEKLPKNNIVHWNNMEYPNSPIPNLENKVVVARTFETNPDEYAALDLFLKNVMQHTLKPKRIVIPVGILGRANVANHYAVLTVEINPPAIFVFDPLGRNDTYSGILKDIIDQIKSTLPNGNMAIVKHNNAQQLQKDGFSCGVWSAWFIDAIAARPDFSMDKFDSLLDQVVSSLDSKEKLKLFIQAEHERNKALLRSTSPVFMAAGASATSIPNPAVDMGEYRNKVRQALASLPDTFKVFAVNSPQPITESDATYLNRLKIIFQEAAAKGILVKLSEHDNKHLSDLDHSIVRELNKKDNTVDGKAADLLKEVRDLQGHQPTSGSTNNYRNK